MAGWHGIGPTGVPASSSRQDAGASPLFFPQTPDQARETLRHVVRRDPRTLDIARSRWTLAEIQRVCGWLRDRTPAGVCQVLARLGIVYTRARSYIHSPDPDYVAKLLSIHHLALRTRQQTTPRIVVLFQDEMTYERHPSVAQAYEMRGHVQPLAPRSCRRATSRRIVATLDASDGRVLSRQASTISVPTLRAFYEQVSAAYADQPTLISLVQDNWPVHLHPDLLARLIPQTWVFPRYLSAGWPTIPKKTWPEAQRLPMKLVLLPTYASWTNPIEKLWRWLRQEVLHLHRLADDWAGLQAKVSQFLDQFAQGSQTLLRYVGLSDLRQLYRGAFDAAGVPPPLPD